MKGSITDTKKRTRKSNRGHRRAFSAPNAGGDRTRVSAAEKNDFLVTLCTSPSIKLFFLSCL